MTGTDTPEAPEPVVLRVVRGEPDATELALGFASKSRLSPGTAKTSVEGMALGGKVQRLLEMKDKLLVMPGGKSDART